MEYHLSLNGSAGGGFSAYAAKSSISPLTCTIFVPTYLVVSVEEVAEEFIQVIHNQFSTRKYQAQERQRMDWYDIMRKSTSWEMI